MHRLLVAVFLLFLAGCTTGGTLPPTLGEQASGYGYIPLDGLAVDQTLEADSCKGWRQYSSKQERGMFSTPNDFRGERAGSNPFKTRRLGSDLESCMTRNGDSRLSLTFPLHPIRPLINRTHVHPPPSVPSMVSAEIAMIPYLIYTTPGKPSRSASPVTTSAS
jgi:hypothetical protein